MAPAEPLPLDGGVWRESIERGVWREEYRERSVDEE